MLAARRALDERRVLRVSAAWAAVFTVFAAAFIASYGVLPEFDHRYRAVFYPGDSARG